MNNIALARNPDVSWRSIEGQAVLVLNRQGEIQVLNSVGTYCWENLDLGVERLASEIAREYGIDLEQAHADLLDFVREMGEAGALVDSPAPVAR